MPAVATLDVLFSSKMIVRLFLLQIALVTSLSALSAQSVTPPPSAPQVKAIYTPQPVYRPEWAKQGLAGKGVVLVTVDKDTGKVTGARMLESTGSQLLDGAALQAYSQWRFQPGTVTQVKLPIEFRKGPAPQSPARPGSQPTIVYVLIIFVAFAAGVMLKRRRTGS